MKIERLKLLLISSVVSLAALANAPTALAACAGNTANMGQVSGTFNIATAGTYRVWSRISVPDTTSNSYTLEVDGTQCNITVGDNMTSLNSWTWVDYQGGVTTNKINLTLTAGTHTYTMYGRESNVKVDRVIFAADATCVPASTGDNCLAAPLDTQAPTVPTNVNSPSKSTTTITLSWAASTDNIGVVAYKIYRGGVLINTIPTPTVTYTDSGLTPATNYNYQISAVDAANNESAKTVLLGINTDINVPPPDTQAPSVPTGLTSTGASATNIAIHWGTSTDNIAVAGYKLYRGGGLFSTLNASTHDFNDASVAPSTAYSYQVSAFDAAGNQSAKSAPLQITTNAAATPVSGDVDSDGHVTYKDLALLLGVYNQNSSGSDLNSDGIVNYKDLALLLANYGK